MNFSQWLTGWLSRNPLKEPAKLDQAQYTAEVMQRVKHEAAAGLAPARWLWAWPQAGLTWAAAAACLAVAIWSLQTVSPQLAERRIVQEAELLAQLDGPAGGALEPDLVEEAADLDSEELLRLAEAPADDEAWVAETLQLLNQLDQAPDEAIGSDGNEDDMLKELEILDDHEVAASS